MLNSFKRGKNNKGESVRSGFEALVTNELNRRGVAYEYETLKVPYTPKLVRHYIPDLVLPNGIIVEIKGRFTSSDRQKHKAIKKEYPSLDVRFVFQKADQKLRKGSHNTYAMWCRSNGFKYHEGVVPLSWANEPTTNTELIAQWRKSK